MNKKASFALLALAAICLCAFSTPINAGKPGMVVLGNGGGSIKDALLDNEFDLRTADFTFSFFAGLDKHSEFKGSFQLRENIPMAEPVSESAPRSLTLNGSQMTNAGG